MGREKGGGDWERKTESEIGERERGTETEDRYSERGWHVREAR